MIALKINMFRILNDGLVEKYFAFLSYMYVIEIYVYFLSLVL